MISHHEALSLDNQSEIPKTRNKHCHLTNTTKPTRPTSETLPSGKTVPTTQTQANYNKQPPAPHLRPPILFDNQDQPDRSPASHIYPSSPQPSITHHPLDTPPQTRFPNSLNTLGAQVAHEKLATTPYLTSSSTSQKNNNESRPALPCPVSR